MNQNISAAETLFSAAHPDIKKITNISALILSLLFCAGGTVPSVFLVESGTIPLPRQVLSCWSAESPSGGRRYSPDDKKKESDIRSDRQFGEKRFLFLRWRATSLYWGGCWRRRLLTARQSTAEEGTAVCGWTTWFRRTVTSLPSSC